MSKNLSQRADLLRQKFKKGKLYRFDHEQHVGEFYGVMANNTKNITMQRLFCGSVIETFEYELKWEEDCTTLEGYVELSSLEMELL